MVRFGWTTVNDRIAQIKYLHSIMVRFGSFCFGLRFGKENRFTFHYGEIWMTVFGSAPAGTFFIYIPLW